MKPFMLCIACLFAFAFFVGCSPHVPAAEPSRASVETPSPSPSPTPTPTPSPSPSPSPTLSPTPGPPEGYQLAFADEFDLLQIDESIWNFEAGPWPYNEELEYYRRENAWIEDGNLVIEARSEAYEGRSYTSARLTTQEKLDISYGYLEVRAALPVGKGTWSAIWLLPTDLRYGGYLHSGEIDIAERVGYDAKRVHHSIHTYQNNAVSNNAITASSRLTKKDIAFHIYGLLWTEDSLRIYQDGTEALNYRMAENATPETWPFDVPFHLILNLAVGGTWGGAKGVDDAVFPQQMRVDYVRYYTPSAPQEP